MMVLEAPMDGAQRTGREWTTDELLVTDQHEFGGGWRHELVDGGVVAHAAPSPEHTAILACLLAAFANSLRGNKDGCRPGSGSGAVPRTRQRANIERRSVGIALSMAETYEFAALPERPGEGA